MTEAPLVRRRRDLEALAGETFDVLIVGGGIVGCGALLDATSRGLRAALVEREDIAVGTSSRSSRPGMRSRRAAQWPCSTTSTSEWRGRAAMS